MEKRYYKLNMYGNDYKIRLIKETYVNNEHLAVFVVSEDEYGDEEPFTNLTVNLQTAPIPDNCAFIDTNNNPWAEEFLVENNIAEPTGVYGSSGFCRYPLYEFNLSKIDKY